MKLNASSELKMIFRKKISKITPSPILRLPLGRGHLVITSSHY